MGIRLRSPSVTRLYRGLHTKAADAGGTARRPNPPALFCTIMPPACARAGKPAGQHADAAGIPLTLHSHSLTHHVLLINV
ncbi:hypothetical protein B5X24_HaOG204938 [Helicoverpa armigera]|uniref:Uncharacterized protein n=1 Tax=Helicoverpa armigera TaxID=29058 RepID=A0A2W1BM59_HELAM|nr:hypothetical protein B5X24_HaOG204938 [Helicoverpa armigera]